MHAEEDRKRREQAEARNALDSAIYHAEKALRDAGDKADPAARQELEARLAEARPALESQDTGQLRSLTERLMAATQAFSAAVQQHGGQGSGPDGPQGEEVVDADFKEG